LAAKIKLNRPDLDRVAPWIALGFCSVMLVAGVMSGLWDPWEMNHSAVARRMVVPKPVLVIDSAGAEGALARAARGATAPVKVETAAVSGPEAMDRLRDTTSDDIYAAVVMETKTLAPQAGDADDPGSIKVLANTVRNVASKNLSTRLILVSGANGPDAGALRKKVLESAAGAADEDRVENLESIVISSSMGSVSADVGRAAGAASLTAQFKSGGRTMFLPPLEPMLTSVWYRIFGYNEFSSRLSGILFSFLTILLVFFPARRLFGRRIVTASMLILGTSMLFTGTARFVGAGMSEVFALTLGAVSFGTVIETDSSRRMATRVMWWLALGFSVILCWLAGGMTAAVTLAAIAGTWILVNPGKTQLPAIGLVLGLTGIIALFTFLPDCAWARQFRFTAATFGGGINLESRSFDFIIKEIGFGFFPWSAFIPVALWMAVTGHDENKPARLLLLLWAVVPMVVAMVVIRPFNQSIYLGLPAMAILTALFFSECNDSIEDAGLRTRLFGFFAAGLFLVMMKDMTKSPAPLVSFLTTDPMFSKPGQGDGGFPATVQIPLVGKLFLGLMLLSILSVTAGISNITRAVARFLVRRRNFVVAMVVMGVLIVVDIAVFTSLKWRVIAGGGERAGSELLRILLTGPDILGLYLVTLLLAGLHFSQSMTGKLRVRLGESRFARLEGWFNSLQTLRVQKVVFAGSVAGFALVLAFGVNPELSRHLSQKHIVDTWKKAARNDPGKLYRHGAFTSKGSEDSNFYTSGLEEIESRSEVTKMLGDQPQRTFFLLPTRQFSEINSAWRDANKGRGLPVLDDRSSRIVLATSRLSAGEPDRNWLAKATLTMSEFEALKGVDRLSVNFEDSLELIGFQIEPQAITRGTNPTMKFFYRVHKKVSKSFRVFMHVDRVGSSTRIHGDHWILNLVPESEDQDDCIGCYATNHWKAGDVVIDTYVLKVPIGSPSGDYDVWMGLYVPGGSRMKVKSIDEKKVKNDGSDRVRVGRMTVR